MSAGETAKRTQACSNTQMADWLMRRFVGWTAYDLPIAFRRSFFGGFPFALFKQKPRRAATGGYAAAQNSSRLPMGLALAFRFFVASAASQNGAARLRVVSLEKDAPAKGNHHQKPRPNTSTTRHDRPKKGIPPEKTRRGTKCKKTRKVEIHKQARALETRQARAYRDHSEYGNVNIALPSCSGNHKYGMSQMWWCNLHQEVLRNPHWEEVVQ